MRYIMVTVTASLVTLVTGCASTAQSGPKVRTITYEEASAFERTLQAKAPPTLPQPTPLYTQPVNKQEPCKLPTTQEQLNRSNFRAYWDGQCKNGFAFGLGRDIAVSDTHHHEEIITYTGTGDLSESPRVNYDFVNNRVSYFTPDGKFPAGVWFNETIFNSEAGFNISNMFGVTDEQGNSLLSEYSPFNPARLFLNNSRNIAYKFVDNSAMPVVDAATVSFSAEIMDPKTSTSGGVAVVRYGNGQVRHLKITGASPEMVVLPSEYVAHLGGKLKAVQTALAAGQSKLERARQMEREYLYMACNGKHTINGLDNSTATKICNWRSQFKPAYDKTFAKYTGDLEQLRKRAEVVEQQRLAQQQINVQQRQLQQQQSQQELQALAIGLGQLGQQMRDAGQQSLNSVKLPSTQVDFTPFKPQGNNSVTCLNTGSTTYCRD
jgi:hypothetical protein